MRLIQRGGQGGGYAGEASPAAGRIVPEVAGGQLHLVQLVVFDLDLNLVLATASRIIEEFSRAIEQAFRDPALERKEHLVHMGLVIIVDGA